GARRAGGQPEQPHRQGERHRLVPHPPAGAQDRHRHPEFRQFRRRHRPRRFQQLLQQHPGRELDRRRRLRDDRAAEQWHPAGLRLLARLPGFVDAQHVQHVGLGPLGRDRSNAGLGGFFEPGASRLSPTLPPITVPLRAPELAPGVWIQGPERSMRSLRGRVVLVDFWESSGLNCLRTLPSLTARPERYAGRGLVILGVHTPEFDLSADPALVAAAVRDEGIPYPVLLDADRANWERFANHYWPAHYLIDARGYLRYERYGEGGYGEPEERSKRLLRDAGDTAPLPAIVAPVRAEDRPGAVCHPATRETHVGFPRGRLLATEGYR